MNETTMNLGWKDKKVRNTDGRIGVIAGEYAGFGSCSLTIMVDDGSTDRVQLNSQGKDSGSVGWAWYCENFLGGPQWLPLGDHNT